MTRPRTPCAPSRDEPELVETSASTEDGADLAGGRFTPSAAGARTPRRTSSYTALVRPTASPSEDAGFAAEHAKSAQIRGLWLNTAETEDGPTIADGPDMACPLEHSRQCEERNRLLRMAAIGEIVPSLLHEIRNPIAGVTTALEVLIEDMENGDVRETLYALLGELRRTQLTLQGVGLADGTLARTGMHQAIDLALRDACRVMQASAREAGITLRMDIDDMPLLPIDAPSVRGVLFNLLNNAIAATRGNGSIDVVGRHQDHVLSIAVRDTGVGMTPEVLAHCTDLFYTTKPRGSGIGLALARRTVESVGGSLSIESEVGRGTTVTLLVPTHTLAEAAR